MRSGAKMGFPMILALGIALVVGCAGAYPQGRQLTAPAPDVVPAAGPADGANSGGESALPPPPSDTWGVLSPVHTVSDEGIEICGDAFISQYGKNNRPGETSPNGWIIAPGGDDDLAWALYSLGNLKSKRPVNFSINAAKVIAPGGDDDLPLFYWVGVVNHTRNSWQWHGPYDESEGFTLNSDEIRDRYVSAKDVMSFIVMTDASAVPPGEGNPDGLTAAEIVVSTTAVSEEYCSTAPHYTLLKDYYLGGKGTSALDPDGQYVTLVWEHVEDSSNWKNEANIYEVWRALADSGDQPMLMGKVKAPAEQFVDPTDIVPPSKHVIPGATYNYYLCSINIGGKTPFTVAGPITIPLYPPTGLAASDGEYPDKIVLSWTKAEGAEGYEIYRDTQDAPLATVGDVDTWEDTTVGDEAEHTYWLKSFNEYATSENFSESDTGFLAGSGD